jgi:hypothetical protein
MINEYDVDEVVNFRMVRPFVNIEPARKPERFATLNVNIKVPVTVEFGWIVAADHDLAPALVLPAGIIASIWLLNQYKSFASID